MNQAPQTVVVPSLAYIHYRHRQWWWQTEEGVIEQTSAQTIRAYLRGAYLQGEEKSVPPKVICQHSRALAQRLRLEQSARDSLRDGLLDLATLWLFVLPEQSVPETLVAQGEALGLSVVKNADVEQELMIMPRLVSALMHRLVAMAHELPIQRLAAFLGEAGWGFAAAVLDNLGVKQEQRTALALDQQALAVHKTVTKWHDETAGAGDLGRGITAQEALDTLAKMLPGRSEWRAGQQRYTTAVAQAFGASGAADVAQAHLLEAGTGIGKTLGYVAPARVWAERNTEPVWISTYSRHLQDQISQEARRRMASDEVVILKGRENYLCLLNYEEVTNATMGMPPHERIVIGLLARWLMATENGIMTGADFPTWIEEHAAPALLSRLRLQQGDCLFSACPLYQQCFIEANARRAEWAKLVVSNHALSLRLATQDKLSYSRMILDEAHQLFDAADSATRVRLGLLETRELARWLLGAGGSGSNRRRRRRGLWQRVQHLVLEEEAFDAVQALVQAARILPTAEGIWQRIDGKDGVPATPEGACERFFVELYRRVRAGMAQENAHYGSEMALGDLEDRALRAASEALHTGMLKLEQAIQDLLRILKEAIAGAENPAHVLALSRSIEDYPQVQVKAWVYLLSRLLRQDDTAAASSDFAVLERVYYQPASSRREGELGLEMIFRDPGEILAQCLYSHPRQQVVLTSASLGLEDTQEQQPDPQHPPFAHIRTGVQHIAIQCPPRQALFASPYDYASQAQCLLVDDVNPHHAESVYAAMAQLLDASHGGGLLLFNAIVRARECYRRLLPQEEQAERSLYSQHDDDLGNRALALALRQDLDASLIGTDAFRDGVDVPGNSLRLVVLERLPWPRPDLVHRSRVQHFGRAYNHYITRQRVTQAFGRLIRRHDDWGSFVLLGGSIPSRIAKGLPLACQSVPLAEAVRRIARQYQEKNLQQR